MPIDLHAHTTASDGSFAPRELVQHAHELGLSAVAVTDHDTFSGWNDALEAGKAFGVDVVPGIELSVANEHGKFHLLGYYFSSDSELAQRLIRVQAARSKRNVLILENLAELGVPVPLEQLQRIAGEGAQIGRPHIARALIENGYVSSIQEAFDKYLADGKPAHANRKGLSPEEAVELIHAAGGVAVWAHPLRAPSERSSAASFEETERLLELWKSWGLDGIEVFYGDYSADEAAWSAQMAQKHGLIGTGGSDFHGTTKPNVKLGEVNGATSVPDEVLESLKSKASFYSK